MNKQDINLIGGGFQHTTSSKDNFERSNKILVGEDYIYKNFIIKFFYINL